MERNSAACVMQWSIELEKALRSKKPGLSLETISEVGARLQQLSTEPDASPAVHHLFDLIPELLRIVKLVFDSGDVEDRALALGLFGCWAHFAKESSSIRYLVLSSLVSSHVMEVKASLFAAGCFAELSEDFACVVLEMLPHMMTSPETSPAIRLAGARVFAKLRCSHPLANNAYKTCLKLLLESADEGCQVAMLVSLSKLASRSTILISQQMDLLLLFLSQEKPLQLRATAIISCKLAGLPFDVFESSKVLTVAENATSSPITSEGLLAISVLVDVPTKLKGSTEMGSLAPCSCLLPSRVISLIIDRITLMVKPVLDLCRTESPVFQQINCLLNLLFCLIREYPDLHVLVLDQIYVLVKSLSYMHDNLVVTSEADASIRDNVDLKGEKSRTIRSKLLFIVYRFLVAFLENLIEAGAISTEVFDKVKLLVELVSQSNLFGCYTYTLYSLLLHCRIIWVNLVHGSEGSCNLDKNSGVSHLMEHEIRTIECANRMLTENNKWPAYRVGIYAACQGAWLTATFTFEQLVPKVHSISCCCWMRSLVQFSDSERKLKSLLLAKQGLEMHKFDLIHFSNDSGEISQDSASNIREHINSRELKAAYDGLCSSLVTLKGDFKMDQTFYFQRWFLSLRAKVLGAVVDIVKVLENIQFDQHSFTNNEQVGYPVSLKKCTQISVQLKRLSQEFDLVTKSFIDMDRKSSGIILELALSCSLLAFCTGFSLYIPSLIESVSIFGLGTTENNLDSTLIQNLIGRLGASNHEISANLCLLLNPGGKPIDCFHLQSRIQACKVGSVVKDILSVCSSVVLGIFGLKSKANGVHNVEGLSQATKDGLQLLYSILMKWMQIPFQTPKYFKFRPCLGSELFAVSEMRNPDGIYVSSGFNLSLNLCLQLRNMPPDIRVRLKNLYCMVYSGASFQEPRESGENKEQKQAWEADDIVEMNEKLLQYVTECSTKKSNKRQRGKNDGEFVSSFARFELNERGQGFSSCLLDVSAFPVGTYRVKWYSCCIDSQGNCWNLPSLNAGPVFTVQTLIITMVSEL
ncbi:hypothetical protein DVH24_018661 [Malus domestica]|uniref:Integrator complex subunit 7 n=1 Tax=Malus domestica TaxID=3750 RepID=A0A498HIK7_MALDO|nr:hypothetical protein DVH24_018661 [Malus domestica]